jgi:hypothetical protein
MSIRAARSTTAHGRMIHITALNSALEPPADARNSDR